MSPDTRADYTLNIDKLVLRSLNNADLESVLKIERRVQITPWSRLSLEQSLAGPHICRVVEYQGQIVAFHIVAIVADELHILNLAVTADQQGKGLGHVLLNDIVGQANDASIGKIFLEVRESNRVAQDLYQKWQFRQIAVRKNYYGRGSKSIGDIACATRENAWVMVRDLTTLL